LWIRNRGRRKNGERVVNVFETWSWGRILKIKWTDGITNCEVLQRAKEEKIKKKIKNTPFMDRAYR
jgi:hypothetical protein